MAILSFEARFDRLVGASFRKRVATSLRVVAFSQYQNNPPAGNQEEINEWAKAVFKSVLAQDSPMVLQAIQVLAGRNTTSANDDASTDVDLGTDLENSVPTMLYVMGFSNTLPQ